MMAGTEKKKNLSAIEKLLDYFFPSLNELWRAARRREPSDGERRWIGQLDVNG